jgi:hypothetical protein
MMGTIWSLVTLPFRLIGWAIEMMGRLIGLGIGFALMVAGVALWAGSWFWMGVALLLVGLVLTLRSTG